MYRKLFIVALLLVVSAVALISPAGAQNPVWRGEYFNNGSLQGSPVFARNDNQIAYNWGLGSPDASIPVDNFSVRWATDVNLSPGTYRFYTQSDDNVRIIFNFGFSPVIDTFASNQVNQLVTGDVQVQNAGTYHIQVDYRELTDQAFAFVAFQNLATNPNFPGFTGVNPTQVPGGGSVPVTGGNWTAQYYANANLLGDPAAIFTESSPTHNWGTGQPLASIPADNWSARWSSVQNLTGGNYTISAFADDGVRVYVNGQLVINQFTGASGQTYTATLTLNPGPNTFIVEYYDATNNAFLNFSLTQGTGGTVATAVPPVVSPTGVTATVTAFRLNVRSAPNATASVLTRVNRFDQLPVTGRSADSLWYQINAGGASGWVSSRFVNIAPFGANVQVVGSTPPVTNPTTVATGNTVTATPFSVVIRSGPSTANPRIGLLPSGGVANVIGRNSSNTWWQINFNGLVGWASAQYAIIGANVNVGALPVTG